ncbi:MAG: hypothetical protein M0R30_05785 [Methanoregula sp.]|jgi:hypothetical protein|uniref:hypothetical protein n=1 Tax=Methanoregula sp. TaxID=2052170 RepID=UPI0025F13B87|nr:hypothetical protein [Methanoregula sp.]MCK9631137.1 hypothetical protein [Methanoregula sp.]
MKYVVFTLFLIGIVVVSANLIINQNTVVPPHIEPQETNISIPAPVHSFPFEQVIISVTSPVDPSVYVGAKVADKETLIRGNVSEDAWLETTYLSMIDDPSQEQFYTDLIRDLRVIRDEHGLNDDEYLELIAVFVQSVRYETTSESPPKFPIETYVDKSGDCDDKSLLLAGLLSREGYNVSLLSFTPESHMAIGVACPDDEYRQTGYVFIETTNLSFVGVPTDSLREGVTLYSDPQVIPVGNGTKTFGSCKESLYLGSIIKTSEMNVKDLTIRIDSLKAEMDGYYVQRDAQKYNQQVPLYNDLQRQRMQYAELHNYILNHQYDRKGTYQHVKNNIPG